MSIDVAQSGAPNEQMPEAKKIVEASEANELFFGVVGHVGSGTGFVSRKLKDAVSSAGYQVEIIKASDAIRNWAKTNGQESSIPKSDSRPGIEKTKAMQTLGDEMRKTTKDYAAVAQGVIELIRAKRAKWNGEELINGTAVQPKRDEPRAYVIASIRHPAEVNLLRLVYGNSFALVGVVCQEDEREARLLDKYFEREDRKSAVSLESVQELMDRDADDAQNKHGQHVADAFWESDFFIDNTPDESKPSEFNVHEELGRLFDIITHSKIVRPTISETGMHIAASAQIRSSCLSRQVGASVLDYEGNVISTGTNEVPKAGGGVYGENYQEEEDWRCTACNEPHCSSNVEQNQMIEKLIKEFPSLESEGSKDEILVKMRKAGLGGLLEFSRAIHAEMDALTSAARAGISVRGARMFVTAFPCHYCARHLVAAGIERVSFIEPYPKSRALALHGDSITTVTAEWLPLGDLEATTKDEIKAPKKPEKFHKVVGHKDFGRNTNKNKVLFSPFVGVAPRLYPRAFTKDRELKDKISGTRKIGMPEWGSNWGIRAIPYTELEAKLTKDEEQ